MTATPDPTGDVRELLMVQNGAVVRIDGYCNVGPDSIQCFEHGVEDWRSGCHGANAQERRLLSSEHRHSAVSILRQPTAVPSANLGLQGHVQ